MLPGGQTDKLGNRYEVWWTVVQLIRIIAGQALSIRIEDPGFDKTEFSLTKQGGEELHQTKRAHHDGKWSLAELGSPKNKLLQAIHAQLVETQREFHFISGSDAPELRELADRARDAKSYEEFASRFLPAKVQRNAFKQLLRCWNEPDEAQAYAVLQRVYVRTSDEYALRQLAFSQLSALFLSPPAGLIAELRAIATDRVCEAISREQLIVHLASKGFKMRKITDPGSAREALDSITAGYVDGVRQRLIGRNLVPRNMATELVERIMANPNGSDTALTGRAGVGKSGCVMQLVELLRDNKVPVLAIRLDRLKPVDSAFALGRQLELEESPALVLAAAAGGKTSVLIIDQLDAVSTVSGRSAHFMDAIDSLVDEVHGLRMRSPIHLVLVCRLFDWENDHRLRKLVSEREPRLDLGDFTQPEVTAVLETATFDPKRLTTKQLDLLCLPQNLALFVESPAAWSNLSHFGSTKDLFDAYWSSKRDAVNRRVFPEPDAWAHVIDVLAEQMTVAQQLSVPREILDSIAPNYLSQMVSKGVLSFDGRRYGFGHESFFDYCYARRFVTKGLTLVEMLVSSEQHLFRRAQVRQVLAYLRDGDPDRYCQEFKTLLQADRVRPHVKDLALSLLASISEVRPEEWAILEPWIQGHLKCIAEGESNTDRMGALVWQYFSSSQSWFLAANRLGLIAAWLQAPEEAVKNLAIHYLRFHQQQNGDLVADLLKPYADSTGEWPKRLQFCMEWARHENSRKFFELFLHLIDNGVLDEARDHFASNGTFWSMLHGLGENKLEWIPEVLSHWLRRRKILIENTRGSDGEIPWNDLFGHDDFGLEHIHNCARIYPDAFVGEFLPVALEISDASASVKSRLPRYGLVWHNIFPSQYLSIDQVCQVALREALEKIALRGKAKQTDDIIKDLLTRTTGFSNALLLCVFKAGAQHYVTEAIATISNETWRLSCGYSDSSYWIACEMISAIAAHCSSQQIERLESIILQYTPGWEKSAKGRRWGGDASYALLSAIPSELRSLKAKRHFAELERKFGSVDRQPKGCTFGFVGSPIEKTATEVMTDDQWLLAIEKYATEKRSNRSRDFLKGGALQLAQTLQEHTQSEPVRFGRLALRFSQSANPCYIESILEGLTTSLCPVDLKLEVCRKAFLDAPGSCAKAIVDLLGSIEDPLPDEFIRTLDWIATEHPDPTEESWMIDAGGGTPYYGGDILTAGINTARGRAAMAIAKLIWHRQEYIDRFTGIVSRLIKDSSMCVRACSANILLAVATRDETRAIRWFVELTSENPQLLATPFAEEFIFHGLREHFLSLAPMVAALVRSDFDKACEAGGRLASLAVLWGNKAHDLVQEALAGPVSGRLGVAKVAATNFTHSECRWWCEPLLKTFFNDHDPKVRSAAAHCFSQLKELPLSDFEDLIQIFCVSRAYKEDSFWILHLLKDSHHKLPEIAWHVCQKFLERFSDEAKDISTSRAGDSMAVSAIVFRIYQQCMGSDWGAKCLDLIDVMILEGVYEARKGLSEFER